VKLGKSQREKEPTKVASVAAFNPDGLLLFGLRNDTEKWTLPGGHFEPGEEPIEAARRELEEETGLKGENFEFLGVGAVKEDLHIYCFRCLVVGDPDGGEDPDEECSEWKWCEPCDIPEEVMGNLHSKKNITLRLLGIQEGEVEEPLEKKDLVVTKPFPVQHYSTTPGLKQLDPAFQGTGSAGQEKNRTKRIPRTYYYSRPGVPEAHVASAAHLYHGELPKGTRLYDMGNDSMGLMTGKWRQTKQGMMYDAPDRDRAEKKLKALGYHGYHNYGTQDALVYFHPLPVRHITKSEDLDKAVLDPNAGYAITHTVTQEPAQTTRRGAVQAKTYVKVLAHHNGSIVGALHLDGYHAGSPSITAFNIEVDPAHRRKGLASAMYAHAEKVTGLKASPSSTQSREGRLLWEGNNNTPQFGKSEEALQKADSSGVWWHGTPTGDLRGGVSGLHVGTKLAAEQALHARIGVPAEGNWDGTREYGKTLLAGRKTLQARGVGSTGYNSQVPDEDHFPDMGKIKNQAPYLLPTHKPDLFPLRIVGQMSNSPRAPHEDFRANGYMAGQLKRGTAKRGFYYTNVGEDSGSISATLPGPGHIEKLPRPESEALQKGFLATAALAGSIAMGGALQAPVAPHVPAQHQAAKPQMNEVAQASGMPAWTPEELHPDLIPIAHLESSFGQNMAHAAHKKGEFHTAHGALGFKPITAHEEYTKSKFMNQKYPGLSSPEVFLEKFKNDPKFYNLLAGAHFARLKARHGDPQKAAYAWRWGSTACANATDEQIKNDAYVQRYTAMQLHGKQLQKNTEEILSKGEFRSAAFKHKDGTVAETGAYHNIEPWLLGGSMNHRPDGPHNSSDWEAGFVTNGGAFMNRDQAAKHVNLQRYSPVTGQLRNLDSQDPEAFGKEEEPPEGADTSFDFGANDPAQDQLHQKALKSIARMHPDNQKMAQAWIAFTRGQTTQRPVIHPDMERHLARFGIVDPKGFPYAENGRSMERVQAKTGPKRAPGAKRVEQPEGLRRYRGLDRDYFMPYQRSEEGENDLLKTEHDPLEAMLQHENPRERILALKNKHVTPYHLRMALDDEDPEVRAFAARHPKMTEPLIHEALHHESIHTRKAALSRPDLTSEHIQSVLFDPDIQTLAAMHPRCTEEQRSMVSDHHLTPPGLRHELLAKTVGFLMYPRLGQDKVTNRPMVHEPAVHQKLAEANNRANPSANLGFVRASALDREPTPPEARWTTMSMRGGRAPNAHLGTMGHETQHGIFTHLKQVYGKEAGHRIIATTLTALDPSEHKHLKNLTNWAIKSYDSVRHPEERIAYLQNYLQDQMWRAKAHKHMKILGHRNAEKASHDIAKGIWKKLKLRAEALTPQEVGVIRKSELDIIRDWVSLKTGDVQVEQFVKSDPDVGYDSTYEDQLGMQSKFEAFLKAGKFLAHAEPDLGLFRQAMLAGLDLDAAVLTSVGLEVDHKSRRALLAVVSLQDGKLGKADVHRTHEVHALMPDGADVADGVRRGFSAETEQDLHLGGRHSKGTMMVRDPDTGMMYLIKPGSGNQSPAMGAREEGANQSRREAAFWHVADVLGLGNRVPRADLLLIDGQEVAALHLLPFSWKNLEKLKFQDPGLPHKALEKYRSTGELHKWAVLDYLLGNPDRHGQNLMVGPEKDDHPVALIDHGSAFAGPSFDPARDKNSFIPYYLRAWRGDTWKDLTPEQRLRAMPSLARDADDQLRTWLEGVHAGDVEQILARYGIDPAPSLQRMVRLKQLLAEPSVSQAINRLWLAT